MNFGANFGAEGDRDDPEQIVSRGGSCIIDPLGNVLAGPDYQGECILTADLDLNDVTRGKYDFDVVGHYARPDVFQLSVNERPQLAVTRSRDAESEEKTVSDA